MQDEKALATVPLVFRDIHAANIEHDGDTLDQGTAEDGNRSVVEPLGAAKSGRNWIESVLDGLGHQARSHK